MRARYARRAVLIGGVMLGVVAGGAPADAAPYTTTGLTQVTGASPLAGGLGDQPRAGTDCVNSEGEPWVAVDRSDNDNIVAAWQQDRWNNGGSRGLVTAFS